MTWTTVYSKTTKGLLASTGKSKGKRVTKEQLLLLKLVDGSSSEAELLAKAPRFTESELHQGLESLMHAGYLKTIGGVTEAPIEEELDNPATVQVAVANTQAYFDAQAEVELEMLNEYRDLLNSEREALADTVDKNAVPVDREAVGRARREAARQAKKDF